MKTQKKLQYLEKLLSHLIFYNTFTPFPFYDTENVKGIENMIDKIKKNVRVDYDTLPIEACKFCNNLHLIVDNFDNTVCTRCGSVNDTNIYKDIFTFLKEIKK